MRDAQPIVTTHFPSDRLTFVTFGDDGSVSAYLGRQWLCNEDTREEAELRAHFLIQSFDNGAAWATEHLQGLSR